MAWLSTVFLSHNRVRLALHHLRAEAERDPSCPPLLLLHGLGEHTPDDVPGDVAAWPGAIWGLDFTGHGRSTVPQGGGYTCELLMADADIAVAHLGEAALWGRGLGGYVAVLLAGARPATVQGTVIADGPGLDGGGPRPAAPDITTARPGGSGTIDGLSGGHGTSHGDQVPAPDPYALHELSRDLRPADYAAEFARAAVSGSSLEPAVVVCASARPPWLAAVSAEDGVESLAPTGALPLLLGRLP
jgi:pimeloyl-ACP methyl ester carboxylesterase